MPTAADPIAGLVAHLEARSCTSTSRRRVAAWGTAHPALADWVTPGHLAAACRTAPGPLQDSMIAALLSVAAGDELAQLTVVAALAGRLGWVVAGWKRAGVSDFELAVLGADLVSSAWMVTARLAEAVNQGAPVPDRVALHLVDEAREMVRIPRRRQRRIADLTVPVDQLAATPCPGDVDDDESLAGVIAAAVREGRLSLALATPVFLTRVAGFAVTETAERLGWSESMVRATRWRAERRLAV